MFYYSYCIRLSVKIRAFVGSVLFVVVAMVIVADALHVRCKAAQASQDDWS